MLKNYFEIDENQSVGYFLREVKEKKNMQYIILKTTPKSFVDVRTISLKLHNNDEKLKTLKKFLSKISTKDKDVIFNFFIESGDRVVESDLGYYDYINALEDILAKDLPFLKDKISTISRKEIFALNEKDKISTAKNLFIRERINMLPIIGDKLKVEGELRPIDLLSYALREAENSGGDFYNENYETSTMNMAVSNICNNKPITVDKDMTIKEAIKILILKKLPSLIVTENSDKLFTVLSYKDVFKQVRSEVKLRYTIEYNGSDCLYEDEFDLIQDYVEKAIKKISDISPYNKLKVGFKEYGKSQGSHMKKIELSMVLSHGKKIIHIDKELQGGTSDEEHNDKVKVKWNVPQVVLESLSILVKKVKEEKEKEKDKRK